MRRLVKIVIGLCVTLVALFVIAVGLFAFLFDANAVKDDLAQWVEDKTGRTLNIEGDIELTYFPWLGFTVGNMTLADHPDYSDQPIIALDSISAKVKLLPLISKKLNVGHFKTEGLAVNLVKQEDGSSNWQTLTKNKENNTTSADEPKPKNIPSYWDVEIGQVSFDNASLRYADKATQQTIFISDANLNFETVNANQPFAIGGNFKLDATSLSPMLDLSAQFQTTIAAPRSTEAFTLDNTQLTVQGRGESEVMVELMIRQINRNQDLWSLSEITGKGQAKHEQTLLPASINLAGLSFDRAADSLNLNNASGSVAGIPFEASLNANRVSTEPQLDGQIRASSFSVRPVMKAFNKPLPEGAKDNTFQTAAATMSFSANANKIALSQINVTFDQSTITGNVEIPLKAAPMRFNANIDQINLDDYFPAEETTPENINDPIAVAEFGSDPWSTWWVEGGFKFGRIVYYNIPATDLTMEVSAKNDRWKAAPISANVFGGSYRGNILIDYQQGTHLSFDEQLSGVDLGQFVQTLYGTNQLSGTINGAMKGTASGDNALQWQRSAQATANFVLNKGVWRGTDLAYEIRRGIAKVQKQEPPPPPTDPQTKFEKLSGEFAMGEGILNAKNVSMALSFLDLDGRGKFNLISQDIDFNVGATFKKSDDIQTSDKAWFGYRIPVHIIGTATAPTVDYHALIVELGKIWLRIKASERLGDLLNGDNRNPTTDEEGGANRPQTVEDKVREEVKDKLRGLFD